MRLKRRAVHPIRIIKFSKEMIMRGLTTLAPVDAYAEKTVLRKLENAAMHPG